MLESNTSDSERNRYHASNQEIRYQLSRPQGVRSYMLKSAHSQRTIRDFRNLWNQGRLNLEPAFQRRSIWSIADRRKLIVSVFDGIPLPSVYLYKRRESGSNFVQYDVIDGKQRLETLMLFAQVGPLIEAEDPFTFRSSLDDREPEVWRAWEDLSVTYQREFLATPLPVITVEGQLSEVAELFVAINATGKRLTSQERRHAFHDHSKVLRRASTVADEWADWFVRRGVFSRGQIARMLHVEFVTELVVFAYRGGHQNKKGALDAIISGDSIPPDELKPAVDAVVHALRVLDAMMPGLKTTRFRQKTDLYSLLTLLIEMKADGYVIQASESNRNDLADELLVAFGMGVDEVNEATARARPIPTGLEQQASYLMTVKEGTDRREQRSRRARILRELLGTVFDTQDPLRGFTPTQRRIVWHRANDKSCAECHEPVNSWDDMHVDHVEAWIKGGKTALGNAALTHATCNLRKGAR